MYHKKDFLEASAIEKKTVKEISEMCGVSKKTISYWYKKYDIVPYKREISDWSRKYNFDEEYFKDIDTEEKAYFLGFLLADGWTDKKGKVVAIAVKNSDIEILERFLSAIKSKSKILDKKSGEQKVIYACSKAMVKDLSKYGFVNNKTFTIPFPDIRKDLIRHFLRGYFDGDGSIGKKQCVLVVSSKPFLDGFLEYVHFEFKKSLYVRPKGKSFIVQFNRCDCEIIKHIYQENNIVLSRKWKSYVDYWSLYGN